MIVDKGHELRGILYTSANSHGDEHPAQDVKRTKEIEIKNIRFNHPSGGPAPAGSSVTAVG